MPPKKKVAALVKVALQTGSVTPALPVGTVLGPHGANIVEFTKACNAATESRRDNVIPVEITTYENRMLTFVMETPPTAELVRKAAGTQSGSDNPLENKVGKLTKDRVHKVATMKLLDLNTNDVDAACKIVEGIAHSTGVTVG